MPGTVGAARSDAYEWVALASSLGILATAAVIRIPRESMWLDEAYTRAAINSFWFDVRTFGGTMFAYMVLMRAWSVVSGATWWLRVPSTVFSAITLCVLRPIARRIGGSRLVVTALPVTALLVGFQWMATDARAYAMETLIVSFAWFCVLVSNGRFGRFASRHQRLLFAVVGPLGIATHGLFALQLIPVGLAVLLRDGLRGSVRVLWPVVVTSSATLGIFVVTGASRKNGTFVDGGPATWIGSTIDTLLGSDPVARIILTQVMLAAVVVTYLTLRDNGIAGSWPHLVPCLWAAVPPLLLALLSMSEPTYNPRYLLASLPAVGLLLGVGASTLGELSGRVVGSRRGRVVLGSVPPLLILAVLGGVAVLSPYPTHQDWRGAANLVAIHADRGDAIVFADAPGQVPQFTRPGFEAAWSEHHRNETPVALSPRRPLGQVVSSDEVLDARAIVRAAPSFDRIWFVQSGGPGVPDRIEAVVRSVGFDQFHRTGKWDFDGDIRVELWSLD